MRSNVLQASSFQVKFRMPKTEINHDKSNLIHIPSPFLPIPNGQLHKKRSTHGRMMKSDFLRDVSLVFIGL